MTNKFEEFGPQTTPERETSQFTITNVIASAEQQGILLSARKQESPTFEKDFGMLALRDSEADKKAVEKLYDKVAPSDQSKKDFADRISILAKDNPEFIEKMVQAAKEPPEKSGATMADALVGVLKKSATQPADYETNKDVQAAFGLSASMVRINGRGDDSNGGAKEQILDGFNSQILKVANQEYKSSIVSFKANVTDSQGNVQHWEDGSPKQRLATGTPFLVLYDEPGRPPGVIIQPTDIEAVRFDPKKYSPPK